MEYKYIAFDLDGTLVDADELHFVALNVALLRCAGARAVISREEHFRTFKGLPTRRKLEMLLSQARILPEHRAAISEVKQQETLLAIRKLLRPDPSKFTLLSWLRNDRWRMCVCSNAVRESVREMLVVSNLIQFFDFYLSNEDAPPKPDPGVYCKAAEIFEIAPQELVVVEDALPGKQSALAAGCRLIEVRDPSDVTIDLLGQIYETAQGDEIFPGGEKNTKTYPLRTILDQNFEEERCS